jgi:hypothetical protein
MAWPAAGQRHPAIEEIPLTIEEVEDVTTAVTVGYVHSHDVSFSWHHSLLQLVTYDLTAAGRIWRGGYVSMRGGSGELVEARNGIVREFLEQGSADWLFIVDTDMGFPPDTVDRLFAAADPVERPIVGALCFSQRETAPDGAGGWRTLAAPTVMDWAHDGDKQGFAVRWDYPRDTVTAVDGTGMACVLIHRSVFDRIRDAKTPTPSGEMAAAGPVWFNRLPNVSTGQLISEDLSFCVRARALNIPIFVHTGVRTTHHKAVWVGEETYWRERAVNPAPVAAKKREEPAVTA